MYVGGYLLESEYENNVARAITSVYPERTWMEWKFGKVPNGFWAKHSNQMKYLHWLFKELGMSVTNLEDFYRLKNAELVKHSGRSLLREFVLDVLPYLHAFTQNLCIHATLVCVCWFHHQIWSINRQDGHHTVS